MFSRTLSGVFCDDIRQEVSGKISLIGCYFADIRLSEFPALLPKLCIYVRLMTDAAEPFDQTVRFVVLRDEEVLIDAPGIANTQGEKAEEEDHKDASTQVIYASFVLSPLQLLEPCILRVRAYVGDQEIKGLGLLVRHVPTDQAE